MKYTRLGKTGLMVSRTSFGALPIQRIGGKEVTRIIHAAIDGGVNFFILQGCILIVRRSLEKL